MDVTILAVALAVLFHKIGAFHFDDHHSHFEGKHWPAANYQKNENSEVVGSIFRHTHLLPLKTRVKLHGVATRAKLHSHLLLPALLLSPTPEEFVNDDIIYSEQPGIEEISPNSVSSLPHPNDASELYHNQYEFPSIQENWKPSFTGNTQTTYQGGAFLPDQWKQDNGYKPHHDTYDYTPMIYDIRNDDSRNAQPEPTKKHFHAHHHVFPVIFHNHGPPPPIGYHPNIHQDFYSHSQSQESHFPDPHYLPRPATNKQNTLIVLPSSGSNFQISQVAGNHNAVSQSQIARTVSEAHTAPNPEVGAPSMVTMAEHRKSWTAEPYDSIVNVASRSIGDDNESERLSKRKKRQLYDYFHGFEPFQQVPCAQSDPIVGAPNIVNVGRNRKIWQIPGPDEADISVVIKRSATKRDKRSVPLLRLLLDPNAQIDIPKTFERMGSITRHSVESKHAPIYHFTNAIGSARDAFMSTLRIPPQDLFVPTKYSIVDKKYDNSRALNGISNEDDVYSKLGGMFRDSIRSGQDVLTHAGEFLHSARKAVSTSKNVVPRMMISSLRVPAFQHKLHLPTVLQPKSQHEVADARHSERDPNFVGVHHIIDMLGIGNSNTKSVEDIRLPLLPKNGEVYETLDTLDNAKKAVGVSSLKGLLDHIKQTKLHRGLKRSMAPFLSNNTTELLNNSTNEKPKKVTNFLLDLFAPPDVKAYNLWEMPGNDIEIRNKRQVHEAILGAINPEMFRRIFNESLDSVKHDILRPLHDRYYGVENEDPRVGIGMEMGESLLTPFMGKLERQEVYGYPHDYFYEDEDYYW